MQYFHRQTLLITMAKIKLNKRSKHIMKSDKKPILKSFSILLERLDPTLIRQYVKENNNITHNLDVHIHGDKMKIRNVCYTAINNSFNLRLKLSSDRLDVIEDISSNDDPDQNPLKNKPIRNLRQILNNISPSDVDIKANCMNAVSKKNVSYKMTEDAWRLCKNKHKRSAFEIKLNDVVMAKVKGYSAWPALVLEFTEKSRAKVQFFGAREYEKFGFVNLNEITRFSESDEVIRLLLKRASRDTVKFRTAVLEAETVCGVPRHLSIVS